MKEKHWYVFLLIVSLCLCGIVSAHFFQFMLIQGESMTPSYRNIQLVVLDKRGSTYRTGEVIAFRCDGLSAVLVKRIAAVPGESVVIQDGTLFVDQKASGLYAPGSFSSPGILHETQTLSSGEYIVIGDNLDKSKDSRDVLVGIVYTDDIIGRILAPEDASIGNRK